MGNPCQRRYESYLNIECVTKFQKKKLTWLIRKPFIQWTTNKLKALLLSGQCVDSIAFFHYYYFSFDIFIEQESSPWQPGRESIWTSVSLKYVDVFISFSKVRNWNHEIMSKNRLYKFGALDASCTWSLSHVGWHREFLSRLFFTLWQINDAVCTR